MAKAAKTIVEVEVGITRIRRTNITITRVYTRNPNVSTYRRICGLKNRNLIGTRNTLLLKTLIKRRYLTLTLALRPPKTILDLDLMLRVIRPLFSRLNPLLPRLSPFQLKQSIRLYL